MAKTSARSLPASHAFAFTLILTAALFTLVRAATLPSIHGFRFRMEFYLGYLAVMTLPAAPAVWLLRRPGSSRVLPPWPAWATALAGAGVAAGLAAFLAAAWRLLPRPLALIETAWAIVFFLNLMTAIRLSGWMRALWGGTLFFFVALLGTEAVLRLAPLPGQNLPDYHDMFLDEIHAGGMLKPGVDAQVVGAEGPVRWITNSAGFRNERDFSPRPAPGVFRILYMGDSFVAGYRVDQHLTAGYRLQEELTERRRAAGHQGGVEVLVAVVEDPGRAVGWLREHGMALHPDLVVYGLCLGNDMMQTYFNDVDKLIAHHDALLPDDAAHPPSLPDWLARKLDDGLIQRTRIGMRLRAVVDALSPVSIVWQQSAPPGELHMFDAINGLGMFYVPPPAPIREAYRATQEAILQLDRLSEEGGAEFLAVLFPQRFQVNEHDWQAAVDRYLLNPSRFDLEQPNRLLGRYFDEHGMAWLDLTPEFRRNAETQPLYMPMGDMHWNRFGHEVAARAMAERIWTTYILTASPPDG